MEEGKSLHQKLEALAGFTRHRKENMRESFFCMFAALLVACFLFLAG